MACLVILLHYVGAYMRMPLLPLYARTGGAGPGQVGLLLGAFSVVAAASAIPGGILADRFGRRRLILAGLSISAATSVALPVTAAFAFLAAVLALAGWAMAALTPAVMAYIGEVAGAGRAGRAYGWYTTALYGGMTLGPALGGITADLGGFGLAFLASGGVLLASLVLAAAGLPGERDPGQQRALSRVPLRRLAGDPMVLGCWGAVFCLTFAWGALLAFFPLYAEDLGFSRRILGGLFGLQALCNMGMRVPVGYLSDRLGVRTPFVTLGMLAFAVAVAAVPTFTDARMLAAAMAVTGVGQGIGAVATGALLGESTEPSVRGAAMGGYSMALYGGVAAGSVLVGPVIGRAGFGAGFAVAAAILVVGAVSFHQLTRPRDRKS